MPVVPKRKRNAVRTANAVVADCSSKVAAIKRSTVVQCKSCPWRVDCVPDADIPNYNPELHRGLHDTIRSGIETLFQGAARGMACHYSKPGAEFPCAGWLHHQLGPGNNISVRMQVMTGKLPAPEVDGKQHETFEATLPSPSKRRRRR